MTLSERGGSTRQTIWKVVHQKFPEADYKIFLVRLKKYSSKDGFVSRGKGGGQRFSINPNFREGLKKRVARGMSIAQAVDQLVRKVPLGPAKKKKAQKPSTPKKRQAIVKKEKKDKKAKVPEKSKS